MSFRPSVIFPKAVFSDFSKGVPLYCSIAFWATKSATISPSDTSMLGKAVTGSV